MKCCIGASYLDEDHIALLITMITTLLPSADSSETDKIVISRLPFSDDDEVRLRDVNDEDSTEVEVLDDMTNSTTRQ